MAESTLSFDTYDLRAGVAADLGWGRDSGKWSDGKLNELKEITQSGIRQFMFPPPLRGEAKAHVWSFLRPTFTLTTESGTTEYNLPDNFGGVFGDITYNDSNNRYSPIRIVGPGEIRKLRQRLVTVNSAPNRAAIEPLAHDGTKSQRYKLLVWPDPNAAYDLVVPYFAIQDSPTGASPFPLGGAIHADTLLASCLSIAEQRIEGDRGVKWSMFTERLAASVYMDRRVTSPQNLGYVGDVERGGGLGSPQYRTNTITHTGRN